MEEPNDGEKWRENPVAPFIVVSIFVGIVTFSLLAIYGIWWLAIPAALLTSVSYTFVGVAVLECCERVRRWAHARDNLDQMEYQGRRIIALYWPIAVPVFFLYYIIFAFVKRLR